MSESEFGKIGWIDLTVDDAVGVKDFYAAVMGWDAQAVSLGDYDDFSVGPAGAEAIAGICHRRGDNAAMPPQWLMYVTVPDLEKSISECENRGGKLVAERRDLGSYGNMCVIQDPAGAVCAIIQPK